MSQRARSRQRRYTIKRSRWSRWQRQRSQRQTRSWHGRVSRGGSQTFLLKHTPIEKGDATTPKVYYKAEPQELFTLVLYDPDAPVGTYLHWLMVNIQGNSLETGHELVSYMPPAPPAGTGAHRYFLVLLKQAGRIEVSADFIEKRAPFDFMGFKRAYVLTPVAQTMTEQSALSNI